MPAFGIVGTFGLTAPSGYVQEASEEYAVDTLTIKNASGVVVEACPKKLVTRTVNVKTKGDTDLVPVVVKVFSGLTITGSKVSQSNDDFPTSEVTGIAYSTLS